MIEVATVNSSVTSNHLKQKFDQIIQKQNNQLQKSQKIKNGNGGTNVHNEIDGQLN